MTQNLVIREKAGRFSLRVNDTWYFQRSYREAIDILQDASLNAHRMLCEAITIHDPVYLEYKPKGWGRRSWLVNGRPQPIAVVRFLLGEAGCSREVIERIIHAEKLIYQFGEWLHSVKSPPA